jgi:hypothetical protein
VTVASLGHGVCFILDLERIRGIEWGELNDSSDTLIYCFDSSRVVGNSSEEVELASFGGIMKNIEVINPDQQKTGTGTCWYQASAATRAFARAPEVYEEIKNGNVKTFKVLKSGENSEDEEDLEEIDKEFPKLADKVTNLPTVLQMRELLRIDREFGINRAETMLKDDLVKEIKKYAVKTKVAELFDQMIKEAKIEEKYKGVGRALKEKLVKEHKKEFLRGIQSSGIGKKNNEFQTGLDNLRSLNKRISKLKKDFEEKIKVPENPAKVIRKNPKSLGKTNEEKTANVRNNAILSPLRGTTNVVSGNIPGSPAQISQSNSQSALSASSPTKGGPGR